MAKAKPQSASSTAVAEPPFRPTYVAAPLADLDEKEAFDGLREACRNASYSLLDVRNGKWQLLVHGSGQSVRTFTSMQEGIEFCRDLKLPKVRCLAIPEGVIS